MGANQYTETSVSHLDLPDTSGVYMITDTISGLRYIGSSINIRRRAMVHFSALKTGKDKEHPLYSTFADTYASLGPKGFDVSVLLLCAPENLLMYEAQCISVLGNTINRYKTPENVPAYTPEECGKKSARVKALWATAEYREKAIAARKGKAYNLGYKCTPEQIKNRQRAGRISNIKRNYGLDWKEEYIRRYPEHSEDINGY